MPRPPREGSDSLPQYLARRPGPGQWDRPTAWLLGMQMLGSLRQLVLSSVHTSFDLRDWMTPGPAATTGAPPPPRAFPVTPARPDEVWLDFFADTGDAPALVYCLAQALQQPLTVVRADGLRQELPRGDALLLGGDAAYPIANLAALRERLQAPMVWAAAKVHGTATPPGPPRPVFAIPGNHDYYDELDGFARQFRRPATPEGVGSQKHGEPPPLRLPGYERVQEASYFALALPFDWQLWGVDLGRDLERERPLDTRQQEYFAGLGTPRRLLVVTSVPTVVHRTPRTSLRPAFERQLGLDAAFAEGGALRDGHVRIDLSGDVHLYERYWGENVDDFAPVADRDADAPSSSRYAVVTAGLGGAFHHPVQARGREVGAQATWPRVADSARDLGRVLTRPRKVFQAGSVGIVGALLAVAFYLLARSEHPAAGPGVLALPALVAGGHHGLAREVLDGFARLLLLAAAGGAWLGLLVAIRRRTAVVRDSLIADRATPPAMRHRMLDWLSTTGLPLLRWFGANPRVTLSVLLRLPYWLVLWAALYGVVRLADLSWFAPATAALGTHLLVLAMLANFLGLPFLTGERSLRKAPGYLALAAPHAVAQLATPLAWAMACVPFHGLPLLLLLGYWCVRPLLVELIESPRRARVLTAAWLLLVGFALLGPFLLPGAEARRFAYLPWVVMGAWLALVNAGVVVAAFQTRAEVRARPAERGLRWRRWAFLAATVPVQAGAILLLTVVDAGAAPTELAFAVGLASAAVAGAVLSCLWLGWYFLVSLQWGWHTNEAGSVARIDDYVELVKIRLTADEAEVFAVAVGAREDAAGDYTPEPRVIDHFRIRAPEAPPP